MGNSAGPRLSRGVALERYSKEGDELDYLGAPAAAAATIVLFTALWIDAARANHPGDRCGASGATLLALCVAGDEIGNRIPVPRRAVQVEGSVLRWRGDS